MLVFFLIIPLWAFKVTDSILPLSPSQDFLETLEDLDLSYNNLVEIPWDTIALLISVNTLSLDHNLIESVPEGIFSNLHKLARSGSHNTAVLQPAWVWLEVGKWQLQLYLI